MVIILLICRSAGLEEKIQLGNEDFSRLTKEFQVQNVGLDFKGARQNFLDTSTAPKIARYLTTNLSPQSLPGWKRLWLTQI